MTVVPTIQNNKAICGLIIQTNKYRNPYYNKFRKSNTYFGNNAAMLSTINHPKKTSTENFGNILRFDLAKNVMKSGAVYSIKYDSLITKIRI